MYAVDCVEVKVTAATLMPRGAASRKIRQDFR